MQTWLDWTDLADADGLADFYGLQTIVARAIFEAGECFIRFRNRRPEDGMAVPMQVQLLESEMCPYWLNRAADERQLHHERDRARLAGQAGRLLVLPAPPRRHAD